MTKFDLEEMILKRYPALELPAGLTYDHVMGILSVHVEMWNKGLTYIGLDAFFFDAQRKGDTAEELDALTDAAYRDITRAILREWLSGLSRADVAAMLRCLAPYGKVVYGGVTYSCSDIRLAWNDHHDDKIDD